MENFLFFTATVEDPMQSSFQRPQMFEFAVYDPAAETVLLRNDFVAAEITVSRLIPSDWKGLPEDLSILQDKMLFLLSVDQVKQYGRT